MNENEDFTDEFQFTRSRLDRAAAELDSGIAAQLRAARARAVDAAIPRRRSRTQTWLPLSTVTAAVLVAVTLTLTLSWWRAPTAPAIPVASEDLEWLMAKDSPDFFSDLEFYSWLDDEHDAS